MTNAERVLVVAPVGRDAAVLAQLLGAAGLTVEEHAELVGAVRAIESGAGAVVMTEHALFPDAVSRMVEVLAKQPEWSDIPLVLLAGGEPVTSDDPRGGAIAAIRAAGNLTVVERPVRGPFLVTVIEAALRARRRQYELRALLERERAARDVAERAHTAAEAASRAKDEFLATVSHELRTPLSAILLWTRLLEAHGLGEAEAHRAVEAIGQSARAQSQLIEDLLDVARMTSGKLRLDMTDVDLASIVDASLAIVSPAAAAKRLRLETHAAGAGIVHADPERLQQVLVNVLSNAVKFTPPGGSVTLRACRRDEHLVIEVTDTGVGIGPDLLARVFEPFKQATASSDRHAGGLGLGLAISRQLVELHGGSIRATSPGPGKGSTFTIEIPVPVTDIAGKSSAQPARNGASP